MLYLSTAVLMLLVFSAMPMYQASDDMQDFSKSPIIQPQPAVYINGDWNITTDTVRSNETIILSGNLTVESGATLTFRNVTLIMDSPAGGTEISDFYHIEVKRGATMNILDWDNDNTTSYDASNITINNTDAYYWFWVLDGSNFTMKNSELHHCGANAIVNCSGLYIETDNATIDHNLISNNYDGIVLYGSDATISNNTITWNDDTGIFSGYWSNGTIENNIIRMIDAPGNGIEVSGGSNTDPKPSNPLIRNNTIIGQGTVGNGNAIQIRVSSSPRLINNRLINIGEDGIYLWSNTNVVIINLTIDGANYGIVGGGSNNWVEIVNSSIQNTKSYDFALSQSYFTIINTTFNSSKIEFNDASSNLTVRWYLHVYV